ncbi:hypothetical protein HMPREF3038_02839 [Akkermansia sp. KLE1797]|nr:hypothetical protein HMPREF3038_02839 [Akkermansia sp. KLE1797]KXU52692.1 hypothetical protein HMPREF3039_03217 [Akkermansia sp. KLE1798]
MIRSIQRREISRLFYFPGLAKPAPRTDEWPFPRLNTFIPNGLPEWLPSY